MRKLCFFYDESFHDRKIDLTKDSKINIFAINSSDIYVGSFLGVYDLDIFNQEFLNLENKYKTLLGLKSDQEFKGETFNPKNYNYGVASFNNHCLQFYTEYFKLINGKVVMQICLLSKIAFLITEVFEINKIYTCNINKNAFLYSIIKFLYNYNYDKILLTLFAENCLPDSITLIDKIREYMTEALKVISQSNSKKKAKEQKTLEEMIAVLSNFKLGIVTKHEYAWNYDEIFEGFNLMLDERNIAFSQVDLLIDREESTYQAAIKNNYFSVNQDDSINHLGIRAADHMSNFIGRTIRSLIRELGVNKINGISDFNDIDYVTKISVSSNWFNLTQAKFNLYKELYGFFVPMMWEYKTTTLGCVFFDFSTLFFALIEYFKFYSSYDEYTAIAPETHTEQFRIFSCSKLAERFQKDFLNIF